MICFNLVATFVTAFIQKGAFIAMWHIQIDRWRDGSKTAYYFQTFIQATPQGPWAWEEAGMENEWMNESIQFKQLFFCYFDYWHVVQSFVRLLNFFPLFLKKNWEHMISAKFTERHLSLSVIDSLQIYTGSGELTVNMPWGWQTEGWLPITSIHSHRAMCHPFFMQKKNQLLCSKSSTGE